MSPFFTLIIGKRFIVSCMNKENKMKRLKNVMAYYAGYGLQFRFALFEFVTFVFGLVRGVLFLVEPAITNYGDGLACFCDFGRLSATGISYGDLD